MGVKRLRQSLLRHAVAQVVLTLEAAGVEFTNGDQPGVRARKKNSAMDNE
jgi:hypothetical protein